MKITGNIIKVDGDKIYIKQFCTGYIYQSVRKNVAIVLNKDGTRQYVNGKLIGVIEGIGMVGVTANQIK